MLPARLLSVRTSRSRGPGGQNVNKVATKVDVRLDLAAAAQWLGEKAVGRVRAALATRLDREGALRVVCDESRSQGRNLEMALERLEVWLRDALAPRKRRRKTRPTAASQQRRLETKRKRSAVKKLRREKRED